MPKVSNYYRLNIGQRTMIRTPVRGRVLSREQLRSLRKAEPTRRFELFSAGQEDVRIISFVLQHGFKEKTRAVLNIKTMVEHIDLTLQDKFYSDLLPELVRIAKSQGRDLDESFDRLALVSRFYDVAGEEVHDSGSDISRAVLHRDKYYLFDTIVENPAAFGNLFERQLIRLASTFRYIAKFVCRIMLYTMFQLPEPAKQLIELTRPPVVTEQRNEDNILTYSQETLPRTRGELEAEIVEELNQVEAWLSRRPGQEELLFREQLKVLRRYAGFSMVRIACVYLRDFIDMPLDRGSNFEQKMFDTAKRNMQLIYDEMANLSDVLLENAYLVARQRTEADYGVPLREDGQRSRFALLLGGANARKEFPSFDYDVFCLYETDGQTSKGSTNREYFEALYRHLEETVETMGHNYDSHFFIRGGKVAALSDLMDFFGQRSNKSFLNARAFSALSFGAGERDFAAEAVKQIYSFVYDPEIASVLICLRLAERQHIRVPVIDLMDPEFELDLPLNIKYHTGGLRDVAYLYWIYKLQNNEHQTGIFEFFDHLAQGNGHDAAQLLESYEFLMNVRIRLDLHLGRNDKDLPSGNDLSRFAYALGYFDQPNATAERKFLDDLDRHRVVVGNMTEKLIKATIIEHEVRAQASKLVDVRSLSRELNS